jgi:hypothetical protein
LYSPEIIKYALSTSYCLPSAASSCSFNCEALRRERKQRIS